MNMVCPNKTLFVDTEIAILYHFHMSQGIIIILIVEPYKTETTFLAGGPHQNRQLWIWASGEVFHLQPLGHF